MATVTRLKAEVDNKNLPIIGDDGNLYNYYYGRFFSKMYELGYTISAAEKNALNAFIEDGVDNGWIEKVKYLLPFIGSESTPLTGLVPLIDNIADYELAVSSVDSKLFSYSTGKITCLGGRNDNANVNAKLPIKTSQMGYQGLPIFINANIASDTIAGFHGVISYALDSNANNLQRFVFCKGIKSSDSSQYFYYGMNIGGPSTDTQYRAILGASFSNACQVGLCFGRYIDGNNADMMVRHIFIKGSSSALNYVKESSDDAVPTAPCDIYIGSNDNLPWVLDLKINIMAFFDFTNITKGDLDAFNRAVFTLTTALGR
jgi:hypothetical protein